jgi:hypothetical protein
LFSLYLRVATKNKTLPLGCQLQTLKNGSNLPLYRLAEVTYYQWRFVKGSWIKQITGKGRFLDQILEPFKVDI